MNLINEDNSKNAQQTINPQHSPTIITDNKKTQCLVVLDFKILVF